jgi:POT family proton-dependent oligopeptide transporter
MTDPAPDAFPDAPVTIASSLRREIAQPFIDLVHAPRALWGINLSYLLEGVTYFGALSLLAIFFNDYIGLNDIEAGRMVGVLTAGITLGMLFLGATVDIIGPRRALLVSLALMLVGRIFLTISPEMSAARGFWSAPHLVAMFGILWIILGYGIYQPACYAAAKFFSTKTTAAMSYAMLYAVMNLGAFIPGLISPPIRKAYGIPGVFWVYAALTVAGIAVVAFIVTSKAVRAARELGGSEATGGPDGEQKKPLKEQILFYMRNFPVRDARFLFFIFILIPVQTLFAHNWLTIPQYCNRAFTGVVSDNYEFFANFSPLLIFVLTPIMAAMTARKKTYSMMIAGTLVMGAPTFLLVLGPSVVTLFAFLILMTVGEAMWSPRFLQWVAEVAPAGMTGIYMGIGQFPWFLTKVITSLYSGWFLMQYCPAGVPPSEMHTETMWFIYGVIAMVTPIGLWLAKGWMAKGFKERHESAPSGAA